MTDPTTPSYPAVPDIAGDLAVTILESIGDGVVVIDADWRFTYVNPQTERFLGRLREQLLGHSLWDAFPETLETAFARQFQRAAREAVEIAFEEFYPPLEKWFQVRAFPFREGVSILFQDVSERRQAELALRRSEERFHSLFAHASAGITILRDISREWEIDQIKSEFISTAAHELRPPLASVMGYAELLLQLGHLPLPEQQEYLEKICEKAEVLAHIIDDLLDLSRIESGRLIALDRVPADLNELLRDVLEQYRQGSPGHTFRLQLLLEPVILAIDREKIHQVMENLLSNAVKYSPAGGTITVRTALVGNCFEIAVADQGIGMTSDQVERIFDKFYRADTSNTAIGGLGLGMTIVRKIVAGHGGEISVTSEKGRGTTVVVALPLHSEA